MKPTLAKLLLLVILLQPAIHAEEPSANHARWQKAMTAFEKQDRENPPAQGGVLFLGSSSIRRWKTLASDFPGVPVLNRGFGGSWIADSTHYFDRLVMPSKPRLIVFYAGGNDLSGGRSPEAVAGDFREFCKKLHSVLPDTRVIQVSIFLTEKRWEQRNKTTLLNTYLKAFCRSDPRLEFVDVTSAMLSPAGGVRPELHAEDKLHMSADGYAIWTKLLRPLVKLPDRQ
jgi:lysophospholipase L1-like esterase